MQKRRQLSTLALALVFVMVFASVAGAVTVPTNVYYTDPATSQVVRADYGAASDAFDTGNTAMWNALRQGLLNALRGGKSVIVETTTGAIDYLNAALDGKTLDEAAQDPNFSTTTPTPTKELKTDGTVGEPAPSTVAITNIAATKAFGVFKFETATATTVEALTGKVKANGVAVTGIAMKESNTNGTQWVATVPDAVANTDYVITFEAPFDGTEIINFAKPALAVSSVSAINATTVRAELATAPAEAPKAGDFSVKVDGAAVEVTAVAKAPNTTKSYDLTIASLNNKEGALEVNGKAATIAGSDFGYDFKAPTVASVEGVDKNHVKVVFSEKVDKATAQTTSNFDVKKLDDTTSLTVTLAALQADGKSVLLTTTTPMETFANGYIAEVKTGVKDVKGNAFAAVTKTIFSGVGTAPTIGPVALSAVYTPATTGKIVVKFDKDISATVDKTKITVGGAALALGDTAARTATAELTISLTAASKTAYDAAATKDVVFAEGAVKDTEATPNNIAATTITPVSAARLTSAAYDQATNILVLTFDKVVKIAGLDTTKITFNGQALDAIGTTANTVALKETSNSATLTLDLTKASKLAAIESAPAASRTLVFAGGFGTDINGNAVADATYTSVLTYTEDKTPPVVESITFNATTDTMVITVNEDVTIPKLAKVVVYDGTKKLFDFDSQKANISAASKGGAAIADGAATTNKKFTFFLKDGAGEAGALIKAPGVNKQTLKITFLKAGTAGDEALKDIAGNVYAKDADSSIAIAYTDQDPVTISAATQTGVSANQVKVTFTKPLAAADIVASKFTIKKSDNAEVAVPVTAVTAFSNNTVVVLTMDSASPNYVNGYKYTVATTARDIYGNPFAVPSPATIAQFTLDTTTTATAYKLTNAVYADANGDYTANAGDKITLTFDGAVSIQGDVTADDFALGGTGSPSLGSNFTIAAGTAPEQLVITLGTGASITLGTTTINITGDAAKKHIVGANGVKVDAKDTAVTLAKPDTDGPKVVSSKYYDANNNGTIDAGDTLEVVFNEGIKITAGDMEAKASGNTFDLSAGDLVLDGTKASVTDKTLLIEIKTVNTAIVPGTTTINGAASANVKDLWDNNLQADAAKVIAKSDTTSPTFSNVRIVKGVGKTGAVLEETDKVIFDISEPVHINFAKEAYVLYAGTTPIAYGKDNSALGFGGDGSGAAAAQVAIDNVAKTVTITIVDKDGWVGANIAALTTFNIDGFKTSFADANGNTMQPAAGFGLSITK